MIYTSYFAQFKKHPPGYAAISVARKSPPSWSAERDPSFAPPWAIINPYKAGDMSWELFAKNYYSMCLKDRPVEMFSILCPNAVLYCWEGPAKKCHRHLISQWLNHNGVPCQELTE